MTKQKIIIDCDPGHDDATAILMAAKHPKIDLLGITTVHGNQTLEKTTRNALNVVQYLGLDVEVYKGMAVPMVISNRPVEERVHGDTGLDGPVFEELTRTVSGKHAIQYIIDTLMESDGDITLVPTGPLTNIAMAMRIEPRILGKIKEIVLMGGVYQLGNVTPAAEFNIWADGEAAHVVFNSGVKVTMMGLDITRKVLALPTVLERMGKQKNHAAKLFVDLMEFFNKGQKATFGWDGGPLHDPTTIAYLIDPSVITVSHMRTDIEIASEQSYGRTNCDYFHLSDKEKNSYVAIDIDVEKFWDIVEDCIKLYD